MLHSFPTRRSSDLEVTPPTPALRTSGIEDELEEGTVLGKESIGLRSVFESGSGKENSSTGPALSFSHQRKVTWTRTDAPWPSVVPLRTAVAPSCFPSQRIAFSLLRRVAGMRSCSRYVCKRERSMT